MFSYRPPKTLRALFIIHYAPLLLIILIGPLTAIFCVWEFPFNKLVTIIVGIIIFLYGSYIYFKWQIFWYKKYNGKLVTEGLFKNIRHPHYASVIIIGIGLAFFFYSIIAFVISLIAIPIMIVSIIDEEKLLIKQYGREYEEFMEKTRWRMIPKIF